MVNIANYILVLLGLLFFLVGTAFGQEFVNHDNFDKKIAKNIVVIEFWVEWNSGNEFVELVKLKECEIYRVNIGLCNKIQKEYNVTAVPTIIVFENGEEKERFSPNIMFQLEADKKTIQHSVDTLVLNKFQ
jgi:hypothetical protein